MATPNLQENIAVVNNFATDYANATLTIYAGVTPLSVFNLLGFIDNGDGTVTANDIAPTVNVGDGNADSALLLVGGRSYLLTVGLIGSGADIEISKLEHSIGGTSELQSLTVAAT